MSNDCAKAPLRATRAKQGVPVNYFPSHAPLVRAALSAVLTFCQCALPRFVHFVRHQVLLPYPFQRFHRRRSRPGYAIMPGHGRQRLHSGQLSCQWI